MSMNVVELFPQAAKPVMSAPSYFMLWMTESGKVERKMTTDADAIRRQLTSCMKRGLVASVTEGKELIGGVICMTKLDGSLQFRATFHDDSWGDF